MEDRAFDKYTGEICHEDDFDACNDVLYITDITYPLYDMDYKYIGMIYFNEFYYQGIANNL